MNKLIAMITLAMALFLGTSTFAGEFAKGTLTVSSATRASQVFTEYTHRFTVVLTLTGIATVDIECSTNGGLNFEPLRTFTADATVVESANCDTLAINVTSYTSGTITARYFAELIRGSK